MKKQLNAEAIKNELDGSVFFPRSEKKEDISVSSQSATPPVRNDDASKNASNHASLPASMLAQTHEIVEEVRKTVKGVGKEVVYVRLTQEEKAVLADVAYTFKRQGMKTSENEIGRIGVNFLLEDFKVNGKQSILAQVIEALKS